MNRSMILTGLRIFAWLVLIRYIIMVIALLFMSFSVLISRSGGYLATEDLLQLYEFSGQHFSLFVILTAVILMANAFIWMLAVMILSDLNIQNPFLNFMVVKLAQIASFLLIIWVAGVCSNYYIEFLLEKTGFVFFERQSNESLFIAGLVFVIHYVFKKGLEIQSENELTV